MSDEHGVKGSTYQHAHDGDPYLQRGAWRSLPIPYAQHVGHGLEERPPIQDSRGGRLATREREREQ